MSGIPHGRVRICQRATAIDILVYGATLHVDIHATQGDTSLTTAIDRAFDLRTTVDGYIGITG